MRSFGLTDATGNTYGFPRVVVYGPDGKIKFPSGGGGGSGTVTSIGITVPSGFSVTPASITVSGTFAITGAGTVSQYIDGTGALQTFPTIPSFTPSALTKTDDTNVTLTLGGTPATALLQSVSLTLGWTGTLATSRGGTGLSSIGTSLQYLRVNSGGTALEYATLPTIPAQYNPTAGTGISITGAYPNQTITNTLPDQTVVLTAGTGIGIAGTYPSFTISNSSPASGVTLTSAGGTETLVNDGTGPSLATKGLSASTGISLSSNATAVTITNSAPDQVVSLATTGTGLSVTGTYPSFTLENTAPGTTYTVDNGLTENPVGNFQLGGTLTGYTQIDGASNTYALDIIDMQSVSIQTQDLVRLDASAAGGLGGSFKIDTTSTLTDWTLTDVLGNTTAIEMTGAKMYIKTPGYTTAANGDVLTLVDNTTGEAEFQTPAGGGGLLYGIASGTNNYTVTIAGVTSYTAGDAYIINFTNGNDADSDIDINGLGVKTLVKEFNVQLTGGDIVSGQELIIMYDGTNFQTLGVAPNQLFAYVTNDDTVTITKGQPVYAFGAAGNRMSVKLAYNTTDATSAQTVGVVFSTSIAPNQRGFVITQGVISGVNTAAYNAGDQLYLGATAGTLTKIKPYAPNHLVYVGIVERANAGNGQIYIKPQNGYELDELHNVQAQTPSVNDVLYYFGGSPGQWKTASIATILGYTPQAQLNGTGFVKATGTTISYDNSTYLTAAITSLNTLTGATQTFATGTTGTDFGISSVGTTHTFNLPTASATNRGALSSADWSTFNGKQNSIGLTTVGTNLATLPNPSAIRYLRINADNSVSAISLAQLKTDLSAVSTQSVVVTVNQSNVGTGFEDVTELAFPVTANKTYKWRATISYAVTGGAQITFSTNGPTASLNNSRFTTTFNVTTNAVTNQALYDSGTNATVSANGLSTADGIFRVTASGTWTIRFRCATAGALTVRAGSIVEYDEVL